MNECNCACWLVNYSFESNLWLTASLIWLLVLFILAATWAKYWMTFFVFSVLPAPDSPLHKQNNNKKIRKFINIKNERILMMFALFACSLITCTKSTDLRVQWAWICRLCRLWRTRAAAFRASSCPCIGRWFFQCISVGSCMGWPRRKKVLNKSEIIKKFKWEKNMNEN